MAKKPFLRYYTEIIQPGIKLRKDYGGRWFVCKESTAVFGVIFDDGAENPCEVGIGFKHTDEDGTAAKFSSVILTNNTATAITVGFYIGSTEVIDARLNTLVDRTINVAVSGGKNAPTYTNFYTYALPAANTAVFPGVDGGGQIRKSISIFNNSAVAGEVLHIKDIDGSIGHEVDPRQSVAWETGGYVAVYNAGVGVVTIRVAEIFYT